MNTQFIHINNQLLISKEKSDNGKKIRKRLTKKKINGFFTYKSYNNTFRVEQLNRKKNKNVINKESNFIKESGGIKDPFQIHSINLLKQFLIESRKKTGILGVLTDDNIIENIDISMIPVPPDEWDVLFLEYVLESPDYNNVSNSIYWYRLNVTDSRHFVINNKSINKILDVLNECKSWSDFIKIVNRMSCYGISQGFYSVRVDKHLRFPYEQYNAKTTSELDKLQILESFNNVGKILLEKENKQLINYNNYKNIFDKKYETLSNTEKYNIWPNISFICIFSDKKKFLNVLHTFLTFDYPGDKLELIIVVDSKDTKDLDKQLPNDNRLRVINASVNENEIKNKVEKGEINIPLGYKLNMGVKYAKNNLIGHLFEENIYFCKNLKDIVKCFIMSGKENLMTVDSGICDYENSVSYKYNIPDLANMLYTKDYWRSVHFEMDKSDKAVLLYKFTYFRQAINGYIPFVYWSFVLKNKSNFSLNNKMYIDLLSLLDESSKKCIELSHF